MKHDSVSVTRLSTILISLLFSACTWEGGKVTSVLSAPSSASVGALAPNGIYAGLGLICLDDSGKKTSSYTFAVDSAQEQVTLTDGLYQIEDESTRCKITFSGAYQILSANAGNALFFQSSIAVTGSNVCTLSLEFNREDMSYPEIPASTFHQTQTSLANANATKSLKMIYDPSTRILYLSNQYSQNAKERCSIAYLKK